MHQPLAYIHPQTKIAKNVVIEPFVTIEKDVHIGEGTWVGPNVTIMEGTRIGTNCRIFPGAVIGAVPQDLKFGGEYSTVEIGNNVTIRECFFHMDSKMDKLFPPLIVKYGVNSCGRAPCGR